METRVDEISDGVYRLSTFMPDAGPQGFTYNQFLIDGDEPFLFQTGHRATFAVVSDAVASMMPLDRLRWISFGHVESDECDAMNQLLAAAPHAEVVHGRVGCAVTLNDIADRRPVALEDGAVLDVGGHRLRHVYTPHEPHGWEACVFHDETTSTLLCGDLLAQMGASEPTTAGDILGAAAEAEDRFGATCLTPNTAPTVRRSPPSLPRRSHSCTARRTRVTGRRPCSRWPTISTGASRPPARRPPRDRSAPIGVAPRRAATVGAWTRSSPHWPSSRPNCPLC